MPNRCWRTGQRTGYTCRAMRSGSRRASNSGASDSAMPSTTWSSSAWREPGASVLAAVLHDTDDRGDTDAEHDDDRQRVENGDGEEDIGHGNSPCTANLMTQFSG